MTDLELDREMARIETECGAELEPLGASGTLDDRARRVLACDDPPRGADADLCRAILDGWSWE